MRSPSRVWTKPRANRNAATISHTVVLAKPASPSWMVNRPSRLPVVMATMPTAPAGSGRHISAATVAANNASSAQLAALNPPCGTSQTAVPTASGTAHRQRADEAVSVVGEALAGWDDGTGDHGAAQRIAPVCGPQPRVDHRPTAQQCAVTLHSLLADDRPRSAYRSGANCERLDPVAPSPLAQQVAAFPNLKGGVVFVGVDGHSRYQYQLGHQQHRATARAVLSGESEDVVRAGYGHIFGPSNQGAQGTVGPFGFRTENLWVTSIDGITPLNTLRDPYPNGFVPSPGSSHGIVNKGVLTQPTVARGQLLGRTRSSPMSFRCMRRARHRATTLCRSPGAGGCRRG